MMHKNDSICYPDQNLGWYTTRNLLKSHGDFGMLNLSWIQEETQSHEIFSYILHSQKHHENTKLSG